MGSDSPRNIHHWTLGKFQGRNTHPGATQANSTKALCSHSHLRAWGNCQCALVPFMKNQSENARAGGQVANLHVLSVSYRHMCNLQCVISGLHVYTIRQVLTI